VRKKLRIKSKPDIPTFKSGPCSSILLDSPCSHSWIYLVSHAGVMMINPLDHGPEPFAVQCVHCPAFVKFD